MKLKCLSLCFFLFFISGCHQYAHQPDLALLLGVKKAGVLNKDSRDEFAGFGKGYAIEVYDLDKATLQSFLHNPAQPLPNKIDTIGWKSKGWEQGLPDTVYNELFVRALNYDGGQAEIKKWQKDIQTSLKTNKFYCAFYYYSDLQNIRLSQLYIYDISRNKLYIIDSDF